MEKKQGKRQVYDNSFKVAVAREHLTSNLGYGALAKKYAIPQSTVQDFVKWYRKNSLTNTLPTDNPVELGGIKGSSPLELEQKLKEANLKITALEMFIENASKEMGYDLGKKYGTKQ